MGILKSQGVLWTLVRTSHNFLLLDSIIPNLSVGRLNHENVKCVAQCHTKVSTTELEVKCCCSKIPASMSRWHWLVVLSWKLATCEDFILLYLAQLLTERCILNLQKGGQHLMRKLSQNLDTSLGCIYPMSSMGF